MVDGVHHLHDGLPLVYDFLLAIQADDGKFTLDEDTVVHDGMVVPTELLVGGEDILHGDELGAALEVVGEFDAIPALAGANEFCALHFLGGGVLLFVGVFAGGGERHDAANEGGGEHP